MTERLVGKVALITGASHGQGRAEAVRVAEEGGDLILCDVGQQLTAAHYPSGTKEELNETVALCRAAGAKVYAEIADVRDIAQMRALVRSGVAELGSLDIVVANAGIYSIGRLAVPNPDSGLPVVSQQAWDEMIDINQTGVWNTVRAAAPVLVEQGRGGAVLITSSGAGLTGAPNIGHYAATKHAVVGIMRSLAHELGPYNIRVNTIHPGQVDTIMIDNIETWRLFRPDLENPTREQFRDVSMRTTTLPVPWVEAIDIANAVVFLASDEARYITGVTLPVDAGTLV